jgi:Ser-Thr-rich glycosyl-phosphatidyl-inositol-anchored membrane family
VLSLIPCLQVTWAPDTSGASTWKTFTIDLMTGANQNMTKLATLAQNMDGTSTTANSFSWTCPEVKPYSAIYFYQATTDGTSNPQWTTRWTIASADGQVTDPPQSSQPGGQPIPWGNGRLINAAPAVVNGADGSASSVSVSSVSSAEATSSASVNVPSGVAVVESSSSSASSAAQTASSSSSGAAAHQASSAAAGILAVVAAAAAFVL